MQNETRNSSYTWRDIVGAWVLCIIMAAAAAALTVAPRDAAPAHDIVTSRFCGPRPLRLAGRPDGTGASHCVDHLRQLAFFKLASQTPTCTSMTFVRVL